MNENCLRMEGWIMALTGKVYDLRAVCSEPGCPVCALVSREMDRYFDRLLYAQVNDIDQRAYIRAAWGHCNKHAHMILRIGGAVGTAVIYEDVIKNLLRALDDAKWQKGGLRRKGGAKLTDKLAPRRECPACLHQAEEEHYYMKAFVEGLHEPRFAKAFAGSDGLCLRHLRMALTQIDAREVFEALVEVQRSIWQGLNAELAEFIRKNDHRFQHEPMGPEGDSWQRVVRQLSGEPGTGGREDRA